MIKTLVNAFKNKEVRTKILITIALLFVYRLGCWLPVPGISATLQGTVSSSDDTLLTLLSSITGGALANGAFLAIGISPYINASIIIQLLTVAIPALERLSKQGSEGRKKINKVTRFITLILAVAQAVAITVSWARQDQLQTTVFAGSFGQEWVVGLFVALMLIAGSMFTLWLGEMITEKGVSNGISLLIFVGILSSAGLAIIGKFSEAFGGDEFAIWELLGFLLMVIIVFGLIVFVDLAERKIPVQYAKQIKGRKQYGGQSTFIPLKVNASGVLPIIFATAIITFPQIICQMIDADPTGGFYGWYNKWLGADSWIYIVLTGLLILFFCYFYAQIQFNPEEVSRNIQQYGGFIPGIRPGKPTYEYLVRISKRITLFGAIYLAFIAIVPSLIFKAVLGSSSTLVNSMSATGMLIVVSVALEINKQLESLLMMKQYKGFLK